MKSHASLVALSFALLSLGSCVRGCSSSDSASPDDNRLHGHAALQFDYTATTSLLFSAHDPISGNPWTTRMVRSPEDSSQWQIALAPEGRELGDTRANGTWILHVLDTVRTAQLKEVPISGSLESFELSNPRVRLKWTVSGDKTFELALGAPAKDDEGNSQAVYGLLPPSPTIYTVQGALLKMLELISDFDSLRLKTLATFVADDVDELQITSLASRKNFQSQREGDEWKASAFLEQLCHLRIEAFVDELRENERINRLLVSKPLYVLKLTGRNHFKEELRFASEAGRVYASESSRKVTPTGPLSVFEIPPEILGAIAIRLR